MFLLLCCGREDEDGDHRKEGNTIKAAIDVIFSKYKVLGGVGDETMKEMWAWVL